VLVDASKGKNRLENGRVRTLAKRVGLDLREIENVNSPAFLEELARMRPDVLFNVAFLQLYKDPVLAIPREGCINFHPGPLPRYGGSNGWVWAIINGEREYGVAFHYMRVKIDTGDIVGLDTFAVDENETGLSLLMKCYKHGASLFRNTLRSVVEGTVKPLAQDLSRRSYYYNKIPFEGMIDVGWSATRVCDFVRAMTFSPFPNPLSPPMVTFGGTKLVVKKARMTQGPPLGESRPGEVVDVRPEGAVMRAEDGFVVLDLGERTGSSASTAELCEARGIGRGSMLGGQACPQPSEDAR
jgi:methionyl-tRNA formyltransferase